MASYPSEGQDKENLGHRGLYHVITLLPFNCELKEKCKKQEIIKKIMNDFIKASIKQWTTWMANNQNLLCSIGFDKALLTAQDLKMKTRKCTVTSTKTGWKTDRHVHSVEGSVLLKHQQRVWSPCCISVNQKFWFLSSRYSAGLYAVKTSTHPA